MTGKTAAIIALALVLVTNGPAYAQASALRSKAWQTQHIGNKLTVPVYREIPFAPSGDMQTANRDGTRDCKLQERPIGNKLTSFFANC